jgi:Viral BACON domain/Putative binding domain, N-terminal
MSITSGASGTGSGTVRVEVGPNTIAAERTGTLSVAGQAISVRQDAASCKVEISPASASFGKDEATASFAVSATGSCAWTATSHAGWLTIVSAATGTGDGTVIYATERNRDVSSRTGTIAVADQLFTVTQAGDTPGPPICEYSVRPVDFAPCMTAPVMSATITTQQGCPWTAAAGASWITVTTGPSASGSGLISFRVGDNWDAPRHGVVEIRWPTVTAGQNLQIQQAGCTYAVSTNAISIAAAGGPGRFDVFQESDPNTCGGPLQNGCMWIAQPDVPWITVTTPMPQVGDNSVTFSVAPNDGIEARTGRISVRNRTVVIMQAGK